METKHQKFKRLAESRTNRAIDAIRGIAKLSNKNHYDFSDEDVRKIFSVLRKEISDAQNAYAAILAKSSKKFNLDN